MCSRPALAAADQGPDPLLRPRDAEVEPDERLLLPFAGSGRDAGAGAELRAGDRDRACSIGCASRARSTKRASPMSSAGMSFFVNAGMRFVTELAKMRAFVELWDEITRDRFGVADPLKRRFRYGVQVNSLGLTEQQPENNAYRILIEMLSVVLSKERARPRGAIAGVERGARPAAAVRPAMVAASAADHGLRDRPARIRRHFRRQQGNRAPWSRRSRPRRKAEIAAIDAMGGAVAAIETGELKARLVEFEYPPARGDRARRPDGRRRQRLRRIPSRRR